MFTIEAALPWRAEGGGVVQYRYNAQFGIQNSLGDPYATRKWPHALQVMQRVNVLPDELSLYQFTHASLRVHICPDLDIPTESRYRKVKGKTSPSLQRLVKTSAKYLDKQSRREMVPITCSQPRWDILYILQR